MSERDCQKLRQNYAHILRKYGKKRVACHVSKRLSSYISIDIVWSVVITKTRSSYGEKCANLIHKYVSEWTENSERLSTYSILGLHDRQDS